MKCFYCGSQDTKVVNCGKTENKVIRERVCQSCGKRFYTEETTAELSRQIEVKKELVKVREYTSRKER